MIKSATTNSAKREFLAGIHLPGDTYKIALFTAKASLDEQSETYSGAGEITGEGYKKGGATLTGHSIVSDSGTAILTFKAPSWNNATIVARGAVIYNASKENRILAVFDFGKDYASTNGKFTATMPPATATEGLIRLS